MAEESKLAQAYQKYAVAGTYVEDGAFLTAAARLRESADLLEQHHAAVELELSKMQEG